MDLSRKRKGWNHKDDGSEKQDVRMIGVAAKEARAEMRQRPLICCGEDDRPQQGKKSCFIFFTERIKDQLTKPV